jgi:hypothetical protein
MEILTKRPEGMPFEVYKKIRAGNNKLMKYRKQHGAYCVTPEQMKRITEKGKEQCSKTP